MSEIDFFSLDIVQYSLFSEDIFKPAGLCRWEKEIKRSMNNDGSCQKTSQKKSYQARSESISFLS